MKSVTVLLAVVVMLALVVPAYGSYWTRANGDEGKWEDSGNWSSSGLPSATEMADIGIGGGPKLILIDSASGDALAAQWISVGYTQADSTTPHDHTITQTGGTLTEDGSADWGLLLGYSGGGCYFPKGIYNLQGGTLNVNDGTFLGMCRWATDTESTGTFLMSGGTFNTNGCWTDTQRGLQIGHKSYQANVNHTTTSLFSISGGTMNVTDGTRVGLIADGDADDSCTLMVQGGWGTGVNNINTDFYEHYATGILNSQVSGVTGIETVQVSGAATFASGASVKVSRIAGATSPDKGDVFTILTATGGITNGGISFDHDPVFWNVQVVGNDIQATFLVIPGDANLDDDVNDSDLSLLLSSFGTGTEWQEGDFNRDLAVDDSDLSILLANFGETAEGSPAPEPMTMSLLVIGGLALIRRRRK